MARVAKYLLLLYTLFSTVVQAQEKTPEIRYFKDLIAYLGKHSEYKFAYPDKLAGLTVEVSAGVNLLDPESLTKLLRPQGIEIVVKGDLLLFRKSSVPSRMVSGYVRDAESGENLIGAHVIDMATGKGVTSNAFGFFSLAVTGDSMVISFIGYGLKKMGVTDSPSELLVLLEKENSLLSEVVISAPDVEQDLLEMSTIKLSPQTIRKLPVFMGETDILKTLQLLPGVQSGAEGTAGFHVRGGGPDQNLILLDGVPVYNANHLFGFFSVFNADAINHVELIKGGFPARYGGRLSSIVDIQMKEGNMNELEGEGAVGLIASKLTLSGPIAKGKTSFMVSGRRTYIDLFTTPIAKMVDSNREVGCSFWDLNAKINHILSPRDRVYLSFYSGRDKLYDNYTLEEGIELTGTENAGVRWGNVTSAFRWNHQYNDRLFSNLIATYSRYQFKLGTSINYQYHEDSNTPDIFRKNEYHSDITDLGLKMDFDYALNNDHQVKFGAYFVHHTLNPGTSSFRSHIRTDTTFGSAEIRLHELYGYVEDEISLTHSTSANAGLHYSVAFAGSKTYTSLQPRVTINQKLGSTLSLKASYARMAQYIHLLVNSGVGLPTDLWVPSTDKVKPQLSDQVALGLATGYKGFEISVENYYKWMENLIEYKDGAGFLDIDSEWENKVEFGSGKSYGVELFVQKRSGRSTGWVSYTWSKSTREFENLNFGNPFPYRYDRTHNVSVVYNLAISDKVDFGAVWVYNTGNTITLPTSTYPRADWDSNNPAYDEFVKHYPGRNSTRMKDYHRLDLSISFRKTTRWGERKWIFGLYNAYNRLNPTFIEFDDEDVLDKKFKQMCLFPIIPNISYQFKF